MGTIPLNTNRVQTIDSLTRLTSIQVLTSDVGREVSRMTCYKVQKLLLEITGVEVYVPRANP